MPYHIVYDVPSVPYSPFDYMDMKEWLHEWTETFPEFNVALEDKVEGVWMLKMSRRLDNMWPCYHLWFEDDMLAVEFMLVFSTRSSIVLRSSEKLTA